MVTSSKILTVTYGTFSCTLEGFDDPFTTLQMVAEYFRKLAAEDRFFGGVPSVPDTETLKRIAEEASTHGVDALVDDNGITLRQADVEEDAADDPLVFDSIRNDEEEEAAASSPLTFFSKRRPEADEDAAGDIEETSEDAGEDESIGIAVAGAAEMAAADGPRPAGLPKSVEETLAAIRQNVRQAESDIEPELLDESSADETAQDQAGETPPPSREAIAEAMTPAPLILAEEITPHPAEAEEPEAAEAHFEIEDEAPQPTGEHADGDGVEDRAEDAEDEGAEQPETLEEGTDPEVADAASDDLEPELASEEDTAEGEPEADETEERAGEPAAPTAEEETETDRQEPEADTPAEPVQEPVAEVEPDMEIPPDSSLTAEEEADLARELKAAFASDDAPEPEATDAQTPEVAERRLRAQALRGSTTEVAEDAILDRLLETTKVKMDKPEQQRRMNALEQLKAAVAATEAEQQIRPLRKKPASGLSDEDATDLAAYREDLRRAQDNAHSEGLKDKGQIGTGTTGRGGGAAPAPQPQAAPLILVSEQLIDEPEPAASYEETPLPQEEVAETDGNLALKPEYSGQQAETDDIQGIPADAFSEASSFSDFAERIGAFELTDLLEAAAAYTSIVEGKQRFSRAQVMSKIAKLNHSDGYTKEAGLRSFGKLLREGKILRVQDGQFGISKASRFSIATRYQE